MVFSGEEFKIGVVGEGGMLEIRRVGFFIVRERLKDRLLDLFEGS